MKTPREILLARHKAVDPKLDQLRRVVISELNNEGTKERSLVTWFLCCSRNLWLELILPKPQAWVGVAALWVLILALKVSTHDATHALAGSKASVSPAVMAEVRQQKLLFAELAGLPQLPDVKPSKPLLPRPRSARRSEIFAV